jgi:hypothetical protein
VRMIDRERRSIVTIAGNGNPRGGERNSPEETNPLKLNLPSVLWMDWGGGRLFISDEIGDLIVLSQGG